MRRALGRAGRALALAVPLLLAADAARAVSLSLVAVSPTPTLIQAGDAVVVEIRIAGLTAGAAPSLTAFSLDIAFNESVLDFVSFSYGPFLGPNVTNASALPCTLANLDANCDVILKDPALVATFGKVSPESSSLFSPGDIDLNQPASGVLGTIQFSVQATGTAVLSFLDSDLSGTLGGGLEGTLAHTRSGLTLLPVPLPEPGVVWLLVLAALGLARRPARR